MSETKPGVNYTIMLCECGHGEDRHLDGPCTAQEAFGTIVCRCKQFNLTAAIIHETMTIAEYQRRYAAAPAPVTEPQRCVQHGMFTGAACQLCEIRDEKAKLPPPAPGEPIRRSCTAIGSGGRVCELPAGHQGFHEFPAPGERGETAKWTRVARNGSESRVYNEQGQFVCDCHPDDAERIVSAINSVAERSAAK